MSSPAATSEARRGPGLQGGGTMYVNLLAGLFSLVIVVMLMRRMGVGRMRPGSVMREEMERRRAEAERSAERRCLSEAGRDALPPVAAALREMLAEVPEGRRPRMEVESDVVVVHLPDGPLRVTYRFRTIALGGTHGEGRCSHGEWVLSDAHGEVGVDELDTTVRLLARRIAAAVA